MSHAPALSRAMHDSFGRRIDYVRMSVTDRCDFRCRYCMAEHMTFLPRKDMLTLEEVTALADILIARGVRKIRLTGGEPLVRRGFGDLVAELGKRLGAGLEELTLTTNGSQLSAYAERLAHAGVRRINVSLDTLDEEAFAQLTRGGSLEQVLKGIAAAREAGLAVKINTVGLQGINHHAITSILDWCIDQGHDMTLIETMPLGDVEQDRTEFYLPLDEVRIRLIASHRLTPSIYRTGGPARYWEIPGTQTRIGFITPLTGNFCDGCNRIRVAATGTVYGCLGHNQHVELRDILRQDGPEAVSALLDELLAGKPAQHDFDLNGAEPAVARHMSVTGG